MLRNRYQTVIEGVWGLGEGTVSGTITPDHYKLDCEAYEIAFEFVPPKPIMFIRDGQAGVTKVPVPDDRVEAQVLSQHELWHLVELGNHVKDHFGCPRTSSGQWRTAPSTCCRAGPSRACRPT